jgi:hypothetical protein
MTAEDIAIDIAGSSFPIVLPNSILQNKVYPGPQSETIWIAGGGMGGAAKAGDQERPSTAMRVLWVVFFPLILLWHSIRIYLLPCIGVYVDRLFGPLCLTLGQTLCCMCTCKCWRRQEKCFLCEFEDGDFTPTPKSLGRWNGKSEEQLKAIQWQRAAQLRQGEKPYLFEGGISPSDIAQGQLGDCWLMAALACLAEHPTAIMRCFITRERNVRGCYVIELYDARQAKFVHITIDDYLPTDGGQPLFAKPAGSELWVLLLEKAFAKFFGDYHALAGGHVAIAFEAMTGDNVMRFELEDGKWRKYFLVHVNTDSNKRSVALRKVVPEEAYSNADFFEILTVYDGLKSVLGAGSTQGRSDSAADSRNGICQGHAYSVISAVKVGSFCMLKMRNPWGAFEWTGAWSDSSDLWEKNPAVAEKCGHAAGADDNGVFWMEMGDFAKNFDMIDICHRHAGLADLRLRCVCAPPSCRNAACRPTVERQVGHAARACQGQPHPISLDVMDSCAAALTRTKGASGPRKVAFWGVAPITAAVRGLSLCAAHGRAQQIPRRRSVARVAVDRDDGIHAQDLSKPTTMASGKGTHSRSRQYLARKNRGQAGEKPCALQARFAFGWCAGLPAKKS